MHQKDPLVQHIRLINGDEIIAFILEDTKSFLTVDHPLVVVEIMDDQGSSIALQKYLPYAKEKVCRLQRSHIIACTDLHPEIEKYYYLSLRLNRRTEDQTLKSIRQTNHMMEQLLIGQTLNLSDKAIHLQPSNNTKH